MKPIRRSQLISPWGVGSMIDFPGDESLMVCGLDAWPFAKEECPIDSGLRRNVFRNDYELTISVAP